MDGSWPLGYITELQRGLVAVNYPSKSKDTDKELLFHLASSTVFLGPISCNSGRPQTHWVTLKLISMVPLLQLWVLGVTSVCHAWWMWCWEAESKFCVY